MQRDGTGPGVPTASNALTIRLVREILGGKFSPGERLPTERDMAEEFEVSRHVVREALKRLEALGLVRIQQGSGAYACDVLLSGGMELFEYLMVNDHGEFEQRVLEDLFVFWNLFIPDVLRLAAINRTEEQLAALKEALKKREQSMNDLPALLQVHLHLMRLISQATHNLVYQLIFNNMGRVMTRLRAGVPLEQFGPIVDQENLVRMVESIENKDADLALLLAKRQTSRARTLVGEFLLRWHAVNR